MRRNILLGIAIVAILVIVILVGLFGLYCATNNTDIRTTTNKAPPVQTIEPTVVPPKTYTAYATIVGEGRPIGDTKNLVAFSIKNISGLPPDYPMPMDYTTMAAASHLVARTLKDGSLVKVNFSLPATTSPIILELA